MNHMDINKRRKYIVGGATAMAVAIASCGVGMYGSHSVVLNDSEIYMADTVAGADTQMIASSTDADLVDTLSSNVNVEEKDVYKDETVYVFADANGNTNNILVNEKLKNADGSATLTDKTDLKDIVNVKGDETFTQDGDTITWDANGNDICYQGTSDKDLPVDVKVTYYLDGKEITPDQLAGQSGQVKIRFDYTNNATVKKDVNGKEETITVPFIAVTGMMLGDNFTNVTVENGKAMSEGDSNIVVGYAMPGMQDSLGIDDADLTQDITFPDYFEMTADVTDFSMDMTVTMLVNGSAMNLAGDIDMSSLDDMVDSLTDASAQLVDGSGQLSEGMNTLLSKMGEFSTGVTKLQNGLNSLASGSSTLAAGVSTINTSAQSISAGINALNTGLTTAMTDDEKQATAAAASTQAQATVAQAFADGQYDAIKTQATAEFTTFMNEKASAMIYTQLSANTELKNSITAAVILGIAQEKGLTYEQAQTAVSQDETLQAFVATTVDSKINEMATSIASGMATNGASVIGTQVADSCQTAAVTAAGQAAGQAVIAGAEGAKAQIAAQINATQANGYSLVTGAQALAAGTNTLASSVPTLSDGVSQLVTGINSLASGTSQLSDGVSQLADGATALDDGMNQFNEQAIEKLESAYNGDLKNLTGRIQAVLEASSEYDTYTMLNDGDTGATKFIIKTDGISVE